MRTPFFGTVRDEDSMCPKVIRLDEDPSGTGLGTEGSIRTFLKRDFGPVTVRKRSSGMEVVKTGEKTRIFLKWRR